MNAQQIIAENKRRLAENNAPYNQLTGLGCKACQRTKVNIKEYFNGQDIYLPNHWLQNDKIIEQICKEKSISKFLKKNNLPDTQNNIAEIIELYIIQKRCFYDFEFWAVCCSKIKPKLSEKNLNNNNNNNNNTIPFVLNRGQRKILEFIYADIIQKKPIRHILDKCRQLGSSTLYQQIVIWFQLIRHKNCNAVICAHVESASRIIRGMYNKTIKEYPTAMTQGQKIALTPYEGSSKTRYIPQRDCRISVGSSVKPDGLRSEDINIAHFSEVAYFVTTQTKNPEDLVQSIISSVPMLPETIIIYESTANGVGNFFHREYIRAKKKQSIFTPIFVHWFEIDMYALNINNYETFIEAMTEKELLLFKKGATLEAIAWYREKQKEYNDPKRFLAEFPSSDTESFQTTGSLFYNPEIIEPLRNTCTEPPFKGDIVGDNIDTVKSLNNIRFIQNPKGDLAVWEMPATQITVTNRYLVVVDVGQGLAQRADYGVITVFDRYWMHRGGVPEIAAEFRGHIPSHHLIWKSIQLAKTFHNALLVVENNSIYSGNTTRGFEFDAAFSVIAGVYNNLYSDIPPDQIKKGMPQKWGFNTNKSSKWRVCTFMRDDYLPNRKYIEKEDAAVNEYLTFEQKKDGSLGAVQGNHDDLHITRAIGLYICWEIMPPPALIKIKKDPPKRNLKNQRKPQNNSNSDGMAKFN